MRILRGWAGAAHPFPLSMVLLLTTMVGFASSDGEPELRRLGLLLLAMLCSQLAIGWSNDYLDRHVDADHQPSKPIPSGLVSPRLMPPAIGLTLLAAGVLGVALGTIPLLLLILGTSCGLAYNLRLKSTRWSAVPFVVAFTVLPLYVWTSLDVYRDEFLALYGVGFALPVAVHIANVLPDLETDKAQGRRTLAVILGRQRAILVTMVCLACPVALLALSLLWLDYAPFIFLPVAVYIGLTLGVLILYRSRSRGRDLAAFRILALAGIVFAATWLAAI